MSVLTDLLFDEGIEDSDDVEWLQLIVGDWQLIADLSFSDLVLWIPRASEPGGFRIAAHCRPTTGTTMFPHDAVGNTADTSIAQLLARVVDDATIAKFEPADTQRALAEAIPVMRSGNLVAVITRHSDLDRRSGSSRLERNYRSCASALLVMIAQGAFPDASAPSGARRGEPRVGDGMIVLNREGRVRYASPNGVSVLHRLGHEGEIEGRYLAEVVSDLIDQLRPVDESLPLVLTGRAPWRSEIQSGRVSVSLRALPFKHANQRTGALILVRDVSEIRRRERELLSRDAMIREMHHRVKNNLQTVSALLRLQERRLGNDEAKDALREAQRRVSVISLVHETLSQGIEDNVDFDEVVDKGLRLTPELTGPHVEIRLKRTASFGAISSADVTSLALALTELVSNAIEHGFPEPPEPVANQPRRVAHVWVTPERYADRLRFTVADDGVGIDPERGPGNGLGTQIVKTLISTDLEGSIEWRRRAEGGTEAVVDVPLRTD